MTNTEQQIEKLNKDYQSGAMRVSYSVYLAAYNKLAAKAKREHKANNEHSVANQMKDFGAKVTKTDIGYMYNGINFSVEIYLDGCVTDYWTASYFEIEDKELAEELKETFDTKRELVYYLFCLDKKI